MRGPRGLDIGLDDYEAQHGIPCTIGNRAAIIFARLDAAKPALGAAMPESANLAHLTLDHVVAVLVASAELDAEVSERAAIALDDDRVE